VLDCFTTGVSSNWTGDTGSFSINSNQLVAANDKALFWNTSYSGDQFASIKINSLSSGQAVALHLRAINNYWTNGVIEVGYTQGSGVAIYTFDGSNWVQRGSTLAASFGSGDVFKAVSSASGTVTVYKNGASIGSASVTGWSGYNRAGQVGLWTNAAGALLDDFDGGASAGGPSNTPTPPTVPTITPTPTSSGGCSVLDCFTISLSSNWTGDTGSFSVSNSQLAAANDKAIFWNSTYSGDQFASIKLGTLSSGQVVALHLRAINNYWTNGVIEVGYTQGSGVAIYTFDGSSWVQRGSTIAASFGSGDVFKAVSSASGTVTVYKNGASIGSANVTGWSGYNRAGQVGLWTNAAGALLDDFDGGASAGGPSNTPTSTTVPTSTPTPTSSGGCSVLDCFTTGLSSNWTGDTGSFSVSSSQLVAANDKAIFWSSTYSGDQFASIKLGTLSANKAVALHLRAINNYWTNGVIEVGYTQGSGVAIYTFDGSNWVQRGSTIATSFGSGDVFKAVSSASGTVTVYKNGTSIGSASVTGWSGYNRAGQVGLWTNAAGALLDDFNGGTGSGAFAPGAAKAWARVADKPAAQANPPTGGHTISYYYFGGQRIAMRKRTTSANNGTVYWLHGDHLGSASAATNASGVRVNEMRFKPFGEVRSGSMPTDLTWTGQRAETSGYVGSLMDFSARFYSPAIGRFISADSIVPKPTNPQSWNRFSYVVNNPLRYVDPTGHCYGELAGSAGVDCPGIHDEALGEPAQINKDMTVGLFLYGLAGALGFIDPSPTSDLYQAGYDVSQGNVGDATISVAAAAVPMLPAAVAKKLARIPGVDTLFTKLIHSADSVAGGALFELEYLLKNHDNVDEVGRVLEVVKGGKREIDFVLKGNIFVNTKQYNWSSFNAFTLMRATQSMIDEINAFKKFNPSEIRYVFKGSVPDNVRKALEEAGAVVEVIE
jgi:RHS repeat-associated protein